MTAFLVVTLVWIGAQFVRAIVGATNGRDRIERTASAICAACTGLMVLWAMALLIAGPAHGADDWGRYTPGVNFAPPPAPGVPQLRPTPELVKLPQLTPAAVEVTEQRRHKGLLGILLRARGADGLPLFRPQGAAR